MLSGPRIHTFEELITELNFLIPRKGMSSECAASAVLCHWSLSEKLMPAHNSEYELLRSSYFVLSLPFGCDSIDIHGAFSRPFRDLQFKPSQFYRQKY